MADNPRKQYSTIFNHAFNDRYYEHMKLKEIAVKYGINYTTVRKWASSQKWKDKLKKAQAEDGKIVKRYKATQEILAQSLDASENPDAGGIDKPKDELIKRHANIIDYELETSVNDAYDGLTPQWRTFVNEYLRNGNCASQAYLLAFGCSLKTAQVEGSRGLRLPKVAHVIAVKQAERAAMAHVDAEYVLINAKQVVARCLQAAPVMVFDKKKKEYVQAKSDDGLPQWQFDSKGANQALELIAKTMGMLTENKNITVSGTVGLAAMSDDELMNEYNRQLAASREIDVTPRDEN